MDWFPIVFFAFFALIAGKIVFGRIKYGSWTGAFLKGSVEQTYGELPLTTTAMTSQVLKIVELKDDDGQRFVGLVITAKAPLGASMALHRLSKDQARELSGYLSMAAK